MTADKVAPPAPAPSPQQKTDADLNICEKIKKEASLTPPSIIDALCEGAPVWICLRAIYVEEAQEVARVLNRSYLLRLKADC